MNKLFSVRRIAQIISVGLILWLAFAHQKYGIEKAASIDAYCPFGAIEGFFTLLFSGEFLKRLYTSAFILGGMIFVLTIFSGRVFCSYFCPLGALQEWLRALGRKIGIKKSLELPKNLDKYLRYLKYFVLILIVYLSYKYTDLIFRDYDPFNAMTHLGEEIEDKIVGYLLLLSIVILSLFSKSWWCRYLCPYGATLGIVKKINIFKIKRDKSSCIKCGTCNDVCPAGLDIENSRNIKDADCISCLNCVGDCPKNSLEARMFNKKISKKYFSIVVFLLFFSALLAATQMSFWETKAPSNVIDSKGEIDIENIRGSNTLKYVIETTGIPFDVFKSAFNLPDDIDMGMKLKDIGITYDIKVGEDILETEHFRELIKNSLNN